MAAAAGPETRSSTEEPTTLAADIVNTPPSSTPLEMSTLEAQNLSERATAPPTMEDNTQSAVVVDQEEGRTDRNDNTTTSIPNAVNEDDRPPSATKETATPKVDTSALPAAPAAPAIGSATDAPVVAPKKEEVAGPSLSITILVISGGRHPFLIDQKYLQRTNTNVAQNDPYQMSVYTLKEMIFREWRSGECLILRLLRSSRQYRGLSCIDV